MQDLGLVVQAIDSVESSDFEEGISHCFRRSRSPQAKRAEMAASKKSAAPVRKGGVDYSKWDAIDSDDDEEDAKPRTSIPGVELPKVKKNDPRFARSLPEPSTLDSKSMVKKNDQRFLRFLRLFGA